MDYGRCLIIEMMNCAVNRWNITGNCRVKRHSLTRLLISFHYARTRVGIYIQLGRWERDTCSVLFRDKLLAATELRHDWSASQDVWRDSNNRGSITIPSIKSWRRRRRRRRRRRCSAVVEQEHTLGILNSELMNNGKLRMCGAFFKFAATTFSIPVLYTIPKTH